MIETLGSILISGALISAVYALVAIGFTMIFGVGGVLNLAHGALIMIGAYTYLVLTAGSTVPSLVLNPWLALVVATAVTALASYLLYVGMVRRVEENIVITFLATLVVGVLLAQIAVYFFGGSPRSIVPLWSGVFVVEQFGNRIRYSLIVGFVVSSLVIGALWLYVSRTDDGRAILATSMSERGAHLTGIDIPRVKAKTWLIAGALAGIAGVVLGRVLETSPVMWLDPLSLAFIIVVVGGIGSIKGSIVAAYLIGYLETASVEVFGPEFRGIFSLIVLIGVLFWRPEGLFGRELVHE